MASKDSNTFSAEHTGYFKNSCTAFSQNSDQFCGVEVKSSCFGISAESVNTQEKLYLCEVVLSSVCLGAFHIQKEQGAFILPSIQGKEYEEDLLK